ncbi:hypothetical protein Tco_1499255 [Tanacetum coccineum]
MENMNPPPTNNRPVLPDVLRIRFNQELQELQKILIFVNSRLESIERFLNRFADQPNETNINDPESDDGLVDTPLIPPFPHSDNDSDDEEVLNELSEYENAGTLRQERIINSFDGDDLAFKCTKYQVNESMKEWLIRGHVSIHETRLYLMRRSLEVLRKFHWMILGGRSNQFSHVSSPLLSKPGEY